MNNEGDYLNFANELKEQYDETQREHQRKIEEEKRKQQLLKEEIKRERAKVQQLQKYLNRSDINRITPQQLDKINDEMMMIITRGGNTK